MTAKKMINERVNKNLSSRSVAIELTDTGKPKSLDEKTRSISFLAASERPVYVFDWDKWDYVPEVLLISGCEFPEEKRCVFLDSHMRHSIKDVLGTAKDFKEIEINGEKFLEARVYYSKTNDAEEVYQKTKEGHVTDVSVGYEVIAHAWIEEGKTATIEGREYEGPLRVVTHWALKELSGCPIGADESSKVRSNNIINGVLTEENSRETEETEMARPNKRLSKTAKAINKERARALRDLESDLEDDEVPEEQEGTLEPVDDNDELEDEEREDTDDDEDDKREDKEDDDEERESDDADEDDEEDKEASRSNRRAVRSERSRIKEISAMCTNFNISQGIEKRFISEGTSVNSAKGVILDMISERSGRGPGVRVNAGQTQEEKFRAAAKDSIFMRCNLKVDKPANGARELLGMPLSQLCREFLVQNGQRTPHDVRDIVGRALSTTDLPRLLIDTTQRTLLEAYTTAPETWQQWCQTGIANDFKKSNLVGLEGDFELEETPEGSEFSYGKLAEQAEEYQIATYTKGIPITRQAIINDDLNALTRLPIMFGEAASRKVGDIAYAALLDNKLKMGDGKGLFHGDRKNLFKGLAGIPTVDNIGKVVASMKMQEDSFGNPVTIQPRYFLAPVAMETQAESFFGTTLPGAGPVVGTGENPLTYNPYGGNIFERIYERRLDAIDPTEWYLAAMRDTVMVFFLHGVKEPYIETEDDFKRDGFTIKVRLDAGAKALRSITMAKAAKE